MKILIAPDKFKGSLTAFEVCEAIARGISELDERIESFIFPMADGGDGFASVMKYYLRTESISCVTQDPLHRPIQAIYQWNQESRTAIIEMAVASGLVLLTDQERDPLLTSSSGTGLLIRDAISRGARRIILGLGGSATNDGGAGILSALGFRLLDEQGRELVANGNNLALIHSIVPGPAVSAKIEIACDVQNPLIGQHGASAVYGPQKGADEKQVVYLDKGLSNLAAVLCRQTGKELAMMNGMGAAGGIPVSLLSFFDAELKQGIEMILAVSGIKNQLNDASLLITGEGKIDLQSQQGKVIGKIAQLGQEKNIPVLGLCGKLELTREQLSSMGLLEAVAIGSSLPLRESMENAAILIRQRTKELISSWRSGRQAVR